MRDFTGKSVMANYFRGWEAVGGKLHFDQAGMTFKSHWLNVQTGDARIEYADIVDVQPFMTAGPVSNGVLVETEGGYCHKLVVNRRDDVIEYLRFKAGLSRA